MQKTISPSSIKLSPEKSEALLKVLEMELARREPLWKIEDKGQLYIKTKTEGIIPLRLNYAQKKLLSVIHDLQAKGKPVRIVILKGRQCGISTLSDAVLYAYTSQQEGINSLILADDVDGSNYLLDIIKLYHERDKPHLRPEEKKSNEKKLEFDKIHSQIVVDTANNTNAGRKYTYRYVHLSEVAFFSQNKTVEVMTGLFQTVPYHPNTIVIAESTANGLGGYYSDLWHDAVAGKNDWFPLFIEWYENPEYRIPVPKIFKLTDEEREYKADVAVHASAELSDEQMLWRRTKIANDFSGNSELFKQEYPAYPEQAFLASGRLRFDKKSLQKLFENTEPPIRTEGNWEIFQDVVEGKQYIIGADVAEGLEKGDNSVAQIIDPNAFTVVAKYRGHIEPDAFGIELAIWGEKYNNAFLAIEKNNHGLTTISAIKHTYKNLYCRKNYDEKADTWTEDLGWLTTSKTRPYMIDNLATAILDGLKIPSVETVGELFTFVVNETGKPEAQGDKLDDEVMALAIANQVMSEGDWKLKVPERKAPRGSVAWYEEQELEKNKDWRNKYK